jgi:hypothetical protein
MDGEHSSHRSEEEVRYSSLACLTFLSLRELLS